MGGGGARPRWLGGGLVEVFRTPGGVCGCAGDVCVGSPFTCSSLGCLRSRGGVWGDGLVRLLLSPLGASNRFLPTKLLPKTRALAGPPLPPSASPCIFLQRLCHIPIPTLWQTPLYGVGRAVPETTTYLPPSGPEPFLKGLGYLQQLVFGFPSLPFPSPPSPLPLPLAPS